MSECSCGVVADSPFCPMCGRKLVSTPFTLLLTKENLDHLFAGGRVTILKDTVSGDAIEIRVRHDVKLGFLQKDHE